MKRLILLSILLLITSAVFTQEAGTGSYKIGDTGPGGGMIFYKYEDTYLECSDNLGLTWGPFALAENYRGGGYDDWYLPTKEELNYIYENLRVKDFIVDDNWYWSSSMDISGYHILSWYQRFNGGHQFLDDFMDAPGPPCDVRAVRSFSSVARGADTTYSLITPYRTTDNLRIRAKEGLAGTALFTVPKDTFVKITEIGTKETIDGISANWVQVEVQKDTVSIQGDTIKAGALGWCFGGYVAKYKIGDIGPGGGTVFHIRENAYLECSEILGTANWDNAMQIAENYRGGGYDDWYVPNSEVLNYVYKNLAEKGFIEASGTHWSSSKFGPMGDFQIQHFSDGTESKEDKESDIYVRAIRAFTP